MRKALIVGIDDYPSAPLNGCVNDANKITALLRKHENKSRNFDCRVLTAETNSTVTITKASLKKAIKELFAGSPEIALLYFSGHGFLDDLGGYLVTQDIKEEDVGVSMQDVINLANNSVAHEVVIILDCCHSGAFGSLPAFNLNNSYLRSGVAILTASLAHEYSVEVNGEGIFTKIVCDALSGGAIDVMGNVTVASIYAYADQVLGAWDQRPMFKANITTLTTLRSCAPLVDPSILRKLPDYFTTSNMIYPLDYTYEPDKNYAPADDKNSYPEHEEIFSHFQKYRDARLLVPYGEDHLFWAAIRNKGCKLTTLGHFYWSLAKENKV
jgi:hypothetical protein